MPPAWATSMRRPSGGDSAQGQDFGRGHSGIRLETARQLLNMLNSASCRWCQRRVPWGPAAILPAGHLALVLMGKGEAL
jgi:histidine ammonia-lyase